MKTTRSFALAVSLLVAITSSARAADCTPAEMLKVMDAQKDTSVVAACASLIKDPSQPVSLSNLDFCKSPDCISAIKGVVEGLPNCSMNGVPIKTGTSMLLGSCAAGGRPPPGADGLPPPGPGGLPPPGPNGLPPPPPGGSPPPVANGSPPPATTPAATEASDSKTTNDKDTADVTSGPPPATTPKATSKKETASASSNDTATVKPAETETTDEEEEAGVTSSGSTDKEEDTDIVAPKEVDTPTPTPEPTTKTPATTRSTAAPIVFSSLLSLAFVSVSIVLF